MHGKLQAVAADGVAAPHEDLISLRLAEHVEFGAADVANVYFGTAQIEAEKRAQAAFRRAGAQVRSLTPAEDVAWLQLEFGTKEEEVTSSLFPDAEK